ncbi:MAG: tRNA pseudouridine(55) synthase TruB [Clostridiaceae bacterium]
MDGVVILLKPPGMTSSNAVFDARKLFGEKRAGHLGTLDPAAAGVLPICLGRATRLFDLLVDKDKEYVFEIAFGTKTDTQDAYGKVQATDLRVITAEEVASVLSSLLGEQAQVASIYSALKVDGRKMYDLARAGEFVEPRTRDVRIDSLELLLQTRENRFLLRAVCSRGTYIRSLCESIAERLGTVAYMPFLLRTRTGPFCVEQAVSIGDLEHAKAEGLLERAVISCEKAVSFLPEVRLPEDRKTPSKNGLETHSKGIADGYCRLYAGEEFLGVGQTINGGLKLWIHLY